MTKLSTQPYKGARDFYPADQKILNYIFETWKKVCLSYGFEEYNGPFLEPFELYAAKSGQELVNDQLYYFEDRGGRKIAIRPEMTPTVARMIAAKSKSMLKPIKWFSIAQFWRYEKPQRGRTREFFQLNADVFGEDSVLSDFEVFSLGASIMKNLGATAEMYEIRVNNRLFMDFALEKIVGLSPTQKQPVMRLIDKKSKMESKEFDGALIEIVKVTPTQVKKLNTVLRLTLDEVKKYENENLGARQVIEFFELSKTSEFANIFTYDPGVVRGLDYYTGLVIEQWDKNPKNNRSLYGGGRYDNLTDLFEGAEKLLATGFAMGDVTLINFLESWNLLPKFSTQNKILVTVLPGFLEKAISTAQTLRQKGFGVELYLEPQDGLDKQLSYGSKKGLSFAIFYGEKEQKENKLTVKNLQTGEQLLVNEMNLEEILKS